MTVSNPSVYAFRFVFAVAIAALAPVTRSIMTVFNPSVYAFRLVFAVTMESFRVFAAVALASLLESTVVTLLVIKLAVKILE
jgi:hypothetical protein